MSIEVERYGDLPTGEQVDRYTLTNDHGLTLKVINYGGIITELHVPDRQGQIADVVLGLPTLDDYLAGHPYFGAIVGRVAGRITGGHFMLDGREYQLACNDAPNHLHGGETGFDKKFWSAEALESGEGDPCLSLTATSIDGEEGYPGNLAIKVTYALTNGNEVRIEYEATTDKPTPLSMTNHSYFNLAGEGSGSIDDHLLQIHTDKYVSIDQVLTLLGRVESVAGQVIDFTDQRRVGEITGEPHEIHGDNYMIRRDDGHVDSRPDSHADRPPEKSAVVPVATVTDPGSGRVMDVLSSAACLQFYTGKFLAEDNLVGKSGRTYAAYEALCLECHGYPDGVNTPEIDDIILTPGATYRQTTIYRFSTS